MSLAQLRGALQGAHVVALVGPAGMGKTTLARSLANTESSSFPRGVHYVECHKLTQLEPDTLPRVLANILPSKLPQPALLVLDGIDALPVANGLTVLQYVSQLSRNMRVLVLSRRQVEGAELTVRLGPLPNHEVQVLLAQLGASDPDDPALLAAIAGNPRVATSMATALRNGHFSSEALIANLASFTAAGMVTPAGTPLLPQERPTPAVRVTVEEINDELLRALDRDISLSRTLAPRRFEDLVAELLSRQGYNVELTPASKDGGKDIYVAKRDDLGSFLYLVECKRYDLDHPVGVEIVRALYGTVQAERATAGLLVTSSIFTRGARDFQRHCQYQVSLRDYAELHRWIQKALRGGADV